MRTKRKLLSLLLCGAMLFTPPPCTPLTVVEARTQDVGKIMTTADGLCEHHPEHTKDCGYTAGTPETPCAHEHTEACYTEVIKCVHEHTPECYPEETEESVSDDNTVPADTEGREPENCTHLCSVESGCITKELKCPHEEGQHEESCGYVPATEGTPCSYVCPICPVQDMIDALPDGEEITGDNAGEIKEQPDGQTGVNVPVTANIGDTFDVGNLSYKVIGTDSAEAELTSGASFTEENLVIPSTVEYNGVTYTVTSIGDNAFYENQKIKTVSFPDTLTSIGKQAFMRCFGLEGQLTLPDSITSIGSYAFASFFANPQAYVTNKITSVKLPANLETLGKNAFEACRHLESVTFPDNLTEISEKAFWRCEALTAVNWPQKLEKIGSQAFQYTGLTEVRLPATVTEIGDTAFTYCYSLAVLELNDGLKVISHHAFDGCKKLERVEIPASVESIGNWAFQNVTAEFIAPNLTIYAMLMGEGMHKGTVVLAEGADADAIFDIDSYKYMVTDSAKKEVTLLGFADDNQSKPVGVLDNVPSTVVNLGNTYTVTAIGDGVFAKCSGLTDIRLPDTITKIGRQAFIDCTGLSKIDLPDTVLTIDDLAFSGCTGLTEIAWPNELQSIGERSFMNCVLTDVVLPSKLQNIGDRAFQFSKVEKVVLPDGLSMLGEKVFYECKQLKSANLPSGLNSMGIAVFYSCSSLQKVEIAGNFKLTEIPSVTFAACTSLKDVVLPASIQKINAEAFSSCTGLQVVELPDGLTELGNSAFANCSALSHKLNLPQSVSSLGLKAFLNCENLQIHITGDKLLNQIGDEALANVKLVTCDDLSMYGYLKSLAGAPTEVRMLYDIADVLLEPTFIADQIYTGEEIKPEVKLYVEENGEKHFFELDKDYTVAYENNIDVTADVENGWARIILTPTKDGSLYGRSREVNFTILAPPKYTVVLQDSVGGTSSASVQNAEEGTKVELTATPDEGYHFVKWQVLSGGVSIDENNSFIMPAAEVRIQAVFEADTYTVTLHANGGAINSGNVTSYTYGVGAVLPTADNMTYAGHTFEGWYEDSGFSGSPVTTISATDTGNKTFYAKWLPVEPEKPEVQSYTVSVSASPETGGTVSGGGTYPENTSVTVTAVAKEGYRFVQWTEGGSAVSDSAEYTFTVTADRTLTAVFEREPSEPVEEKHEGLWVSGLQYTVPYTGAPVRQENIKVYHNSTRLQEKTEYTISYKNNKNAGTAQLIVTGKGNYKGKVTEPFTIEAIDLNRETQNNISANVATAAATGRKLKPAVTVTWNQKKLKEKKDYTLTYDTNITAASADGYDIIINGTGNYTGSITRKFHVMPKGTKLLNNAKVTGLAKSYPYQDTAENALPQGLQTDLANLTVKIGKTTLTQGADYIVRMENADAVGTASLIIEPAQTSSYAGEKRVPVLITGTNLKKCSVTGLEKSYPYTGVPITPDITVFTGKNGTGTQIPEDAYTVRCTNNTRSGKATLTVTGIAKKGVNGTLKATYTISKMDLADGESAGTITVQLPGTASYAKGGAKPQPAITHTEGGTVYNLRENIDYKVKYKNNTAVSIDNTDRSAARQPAVIITGIGNYSGTITKPFAIVRQDISLLTIAVSDKSYSAKKKGRAYYSAPKVYDLDGKRLKPNTDYTVRYTDDATGSEIGKTDIVQNGAKIRVTITAAETSKSGYSGTLSTTYFVRGATDVKDIAKAKIDKIKPQHYTESPICPEVRLYTTKNKTKTYLTEEEDYEIVGCYNNVRKGTATILIKGKGSFSGIKTVTFKIISADNPSIWSGVF